MRRIGKLPLLFASLALLALLLVAAVMVTRALTQPAGARFLPSATPAYVPQQGDSFRVYLDENISRIRSALQATYYDASPSPFGPGFDIDRVTDMRSPYEIAPEPGTCTMTPDGKHETGILLVHGLTDSPYLTRTVARSLGELFPCALVRGLLSPGHGTVPGDLLNVRLEDWMTTLEFGIEGLAEQAETVHLLGYSNGSALAINYLIDKGEDNQVDSLIFISPGLKTDDPRAWITPWARVALRWLNVRADTDPVKYESFTTNAAAEFYQATRRLEQDDSILDLPVLMIVSGDDATVSSRYSREFFCSRLSNPANKLIWMQSHITPLTESDLCEGMVIRDPHFEDLPGFVSYSHVSLMLPASDAVYGMNGRIKVCTSYEEQPDLMAACQADEEDTVYAEHNYKETDGRYEGRLVRRSSFNPAYDEMLLDIYCFISGICQIYESNDEVLELHAHDH